MIRESVLVKLVSFCMAISCFITAFLSFQLFGEGMWFWVIIGVGLTTLIALFNDKVQPVAVVFSGLLALVSVGAVLLGLVAATIGGSFKMDSASAFLLFFFGLIAVFGSTMVYLNKKRLKKEQNFQA